MRRPDRFIITCEHAGNKVPAAYRRCFKGAEEVLESHRGYDPGAIAVAKSYSRRLDAPLFLSQTSRLLIDLNRSLDHPRCFSEFTSGLPEEEREAIAARYYRPFREEVAAAIHHLHLRDFRVVHLGIHTFTPVMDGKARTADIAWLYDPARDAESDYVDSWSEHFRAIASEFRLRRNYPYLGKSDGHTTSLRARFGEDRYLGLELELNHGLMADRARWTHLVKSTLRSLQAMAGGVRE
jgi:predicted N-formylglutamate amidohydrolase